MSATYTTISGFFVQDDPAAVGSAIGALPPRFGLLDDSADCWATFKAKIDELNARAPAGTAYKVFWLGRHGQGYHNLAEAKYGSRAWDDHWSKLNGDGETVWGPDPLLTRLGELQAEEAHAAWLQEAPRGVPLPQTCFASPLKRALDTWKITFDRAGAAAVLPAEARRVLVLENCREEYGVHTCDLRSTLSHLRTLYTPPTYAFEAGFAEEDPLWDADERESTPHRIGRAISVLDTAFAGDATYISITAHGGFINGFLNAVGRPNYSLPTGGVLPIVVQRTAGAPAN
ncbi:phosphoglycerate mutase-like protein [Phanerochaete sordida]|uniref:Phosphoglycerate mutase-like protein n=1 Tax=Phanerochaete sordida TaxID=48140 RepID=A0A9P3LMN7_9APHY|nr:phosphoglycerate mutase-like protein [Phanerochaete sordida]